jgi:ornithine cyclodeaminase/alanine dehydrogenase-like protein (mu-crystallin family)
MAGSNFAERRKPDTEGLHPAYRVVVPSAEVARLQRGDLLMNGFDQDRLGGLCPIIAGRAAGQREAEIRVFEPPGFALEDPARAVRVLRRTRELGLGTEPSA